MHLAVLTATGPGHPLIGPAHPIAFDSPGDTLGAGEFLTGLTFVPGHVVLAHELYLVRLHTMRVNTAVEELCPLSGDLANLITLVAGDRNRTSK